MHNIKVDLLVARTSEPIDEYGARPNDMRETDHQGHPQHGEVFIAPQTHRYVVTGEEVRECVGLQVTRELDLKEILTHAHNARDAKNESDKKSMAAEIFYR